MIEDFRRQVLDRKASLTGSFMSQSVTFMLLPCSRAFGFLLVVSQELLFQ